MSVRRFGLSICGVFAGVSVMLLFLYAIGLRWQQPTVAVFQPLEILPTDSETTTLAKITLPASVPDTQLVLEEIVSYDGAYLEDGSFEEVTNVAAALIHNEGDRWVSAAEITLTVEETRFVFFVQELPPGESALVLERTRQKIKQRDFTDVSGVCNYYNGEQTDGITADISSGVLTLTNTTQTDVADILVYYKTVYGDGLFYMGGKVHILPVEKLVAGERVYLQPPYFAGDDSRILRIEYKKSSIDSMEDLSVKELWIGNPAIWDSWGW